MKNHSIDLIQGPPRCGNAQSWWRHHCSRARRASGAPLRSAAVALALLLAPGLASAQGVDLVELRSEYLRPTALEGGRPAGRTPWSNADDVQVSTYEVKLNVPLSLSDSTLLVPGLGYRLDSLSFSHESPAERELDLYSLEVPVTLMHLLSSKWMLLLNVAPGISTDLDEVDERALRLGGVALASYQFSDNFALGAGAAVSFDFGSLLPIPVVNVQWEPHPAVSVEAMLPVLFDAKVALGDRFEVGVHADIEGSSYAIGNSKIRGAWPCAAETDDPTTADDESKADKAKCIDQVGYSVATAGGVLGVRVVSSVWLNLYAGHTFFRRFEQMNENSERVAGGTQDLPDVFFARVGLTWRLPDGDSDSSQKQGSAGAQSEAP